MTDYGDYQNMSIKDQSKTTKFFFVDRGDSYKPNKHINHIATDSLVGQGFSLREENPLFSDMISEHNIVNYSFTQASENIFNENYASEF